MVYAFEDFVLDEQRGELTRHGSAVTIQPKAFELLLFLVRHRDRILKKDEP